MKNPQGNLERLSAQFLNGYQWATDNAAAHLGVLNAKDWGIRHCVKLSDRPVLGKGRGEQFVDEVVC
jgi:hypothetical protein